MATAPEITQHHVDLAMGAARRLLNTQLGRWAGRDELESQALVALWELALSFDESRGVPFSAYISMYVRTKVLDWLRCAYGRIDNGKVSTRLKVSMESCSLEGILNEDGEQHHVLASTEPGPEQVALDRDELRRLRDLLGELNDYQRDQLLWPVDGREGQAVAASWGKNKSNFGSHQRWTRTRVLKALDRPQVANTSRPGW